MARRKRDGYLLRSIGRFPGLRLRTQPQQGALDLLNVSFTDLGGLRSRDGHAPFGGETHTGGIQSLGRFYATGGQRRLIVARVTALKALDQAGALAHTAAGGAVPTAAMTSYARSGAPGAERLYMGNGVDTVRRYDLAAGFTAPTCTTVAALTGVATPGQAMPKAACVAFWGQEARTVYGGFDSANSGPGGSALSDNDTIWISEPNDPERFRDDSFIRVAPGNGEKTMAIVAWGDSIFIFKETVFFVLQGTIVNQAGGTTFRRRAVQADVGPCGRRAVSIGRDGVYLVGRKGLYRTQGEVPTLLSSDLDPLWGEAPLPSWYTGGRIDPAHLTNVQLEVVGNQAYAAFRSDLATAADQDRTLVYDLRDQQFSLWSVAARALCGFRAGNTEELHLGSPNSNVVQAIRENVLGDDGQPFRSFYLGGYDELAEGRVVRVRQSALYGFGHVDYGLACDFEPIGVTVSIDFGSSIDTWGNGTNPSDTWGDGTDLSDLWGLGISVEPKMARRAYRAAFAAVWIGHTPAALGNQSAWVVHRVTQHLAGVKAPSALEGSRP